jgi:O-methyltransferase
MKSKLKQFAKYCFKHVARIPAKSNWYFVKSLMYDIEGRPQLAINRDYVRHKTLELCAYEIHLNNVKGNVAELGVFKGEFAKKINQLFPERKFYLFDTFEGFDTRDIKDETTNKYSTGDQDFSNTSIEFVLKKMKTPENCIVRKGYFPETAEGVEDKFCFVSLDADLYKPILNGLEYFYPRLERNGYIFVHDFNNVLYKGAREAVIKYCSENNISYTPIPDISGTVIITK